VAKETNLPAIAATPFAEQKMNPETDALKEGKFMIQRLGLKPAGLPAIR
jgi:hypothetical protein